MPAARIGLCPLPSPRAALAGGRAPVFFVRPKGDEQMKWLMDLIKLIDHWLGGSQG
jgi:hypothetical protein